MNIPNDLSEEFLYHIWDEGHLLLDRLRTTDGRCVEVIFRGRWNMDTGPDFRDALLRIGDRLVRGDVELHLREEDWYAHGHHADPRYRNVILHGILLAANRPSPAVTSEGRIVPTIVLSRYFDDRIARLRSRVRGERTQHGWPPTCLLSRKEPAKILEVLQYWGIRRLEMRKERYAELRRALSWNQLFLLGIAEALGYSKNQRPFVLLIRRLPTKELFAFAAREPERARQRYEAVLFGVAGMLEKEEKMLPDSRAYWLLLREIWDDFRSCYPVSPLAAGEWQFFRLRPLNFPTLRIAALAGLFVRFGQWGFVDPFLNAFRDLKNHPQRILGELCRLLMVNSTGFWERNVHFRGDHLLRRPIRRLIGRQRAAEMAVNVIFPLVMLYAEECGDLELASLCKAAYLSAPPLQENEITRTLSRRLGINRRTFRQRMAACEHQGMIQLARFYCPRWYCQLCVHPSARDGTFRDDGPIPT